jgi:hypothetical protein
VVAGKAISAGDGEIVFYLFPENPFARVYEPKVLCPLPPEGEGQGEENHFVTAQKLPANGGVFEKHDKKAYEYD